MTSLWLLIAARWMGVWPSLSCEEVEYLSSLTKYLTTSKCPEKAAK